MPNTPTSDAPPALPPRRWATVTELSQITPRVVRLLLQGDELAGFQPGFPGAHIKLILPPPGEVRPATPVRYDGRRAVFADGVTPPALRTYTPLRFDPEQRSLEVELLLHGEGEAADWLRRAKIGDEILVAGPRGGWEVPQDGNWYVVLADETAIPAATQVLEALPNTQSFVAFEVMDERERRAGLVAERKPTWLLRGAETARAGIPLEEYLRGLTLPPGRGYVWIACEANAMRRIRRHLLQERRLAAGQIVTRGYWKLGSANHPDGDYGQDEPGHP